MPTVFKTGVLVEYRTRCTNPECGREQFVTHGRSWLVGEIIEPAKGHGDLGRCYYCRHDGLLVLQIYEAEPEPVNARPPWS